MSTKDGYVRSINGICCVEFSQCLKVKYFKPVQSFLLLSKTLQVKQALSISLLCYFRKVMVPLTSVVRRCACELLGNLNIEQGKPGQKI